MVSKRKKYRPQLLVFDFDGVLTDNFVYVLSDGREAVRCTRSDGLGFDLLHRAKVPVLILSTEKNEVVRCRAKKLRCPVLHGIGDKAKALQRYCADRDIPLAAVAFVGNDLNDLAVMKIVGQCYCPADAHPQIKKIAKVLPIAGGMGVARAVAEQELGLDY